MKKIKNLIIVIITFLIIIGLLMLANKDFKKNNVKTIEISPTPTIINENDSDNNGGGLDEFSDQEKKTMELIAVLRRNCPIKNDNFSLSFDIMKIIFTVEIKEPSGKEYFLSWLKNEGYDEIPIEYFVFK